MGGKGLSSGRYLPPAAHPLAALCGTGSGLVWPKPNIKHVWSQAIHITFCHAHLKRNSRVTHTRDSRVTHTRAHRWRLCGARKPAARACLFMCMCCVSCVTALCPGRGLSSLLKISPQFTRDHAGPRQTANHAANHACFRLGPRPGVRVRLLRADLWFRKELLVTALTLPPAGTSTPVFSKRFHALC